MHVAHRVFVALRGRAVFFHRELVPLDSLNRLFTLAVTGQLHFVSDAHVVNSVVLNHLCHFALGLGTRGLRLLIGEVVEVAVYLNREVTVRVVLLHVFLGFFDGGHVRLGQRDHVGSDFFLLLWRAVTPLKLFGSVDSLNTLESRDHAQRYTLRNTIRMNSNLIL